MFHIHVFRLSHKTIGTKYFECRCGERTFKTYPSGGHRPIDKHWLRTGKQKRKAIAPKKPTDSGISADPFYGL